jgi:hypothetical protein
VGDGQGCCYSLSESCVCVCMCVCVYVCVCVCVHVYINCILYSIRIFTSLVLCILVVSLYEL